MQTEFKLTVIAACGGDIRRQQTLAMSVLNKAQGVELLIVGGEPDEKAKSYAGEKNSTAFVKGGFADALKEAHAPLVMFVPDTVTLASGAAKAISDMGSACVFNAATGSTTAPEKLLRDNFAPFEAFAAPVGANFVMRTDVLKAHSLEPAADTAAAVCALAAEYLQFDSFTPLHSVLMYNAALAEASVTEFSALCEAAKPTISGENKSAVLCAVSMLMYFFVSLDSAEREKSVTALRSAVSPALADEAVGAFVLSHFGIDPAMFADSTVPDCDALALGQNVMYKEVSLPILADDVVRDFYGGKLSFNTLRRSIAAWLYFKLYRMGGVAKKLGCAVCRRLVGGDFNV